MKKNLTVLFLSFLLNLNSAEIEPVNMYRNNALRQGQYETSALKHVTGIKWNIKIGKGIMSSPVIDEGTLYIGSDDSNMYAINKETGALIWKYQARREVRSSALIVYGNVYFTDYKNFLYAIDKKTGVLKWEYNLYNYSKFALDPSKSGYDDYLPSPAFYKNMILACSFDPTHPLFAFDPITGSEKWVFNAESSDMFYGSPAVFNDIVYCGGMSKGVFAINANTGKLVWDYKIENFPIKYSAVIGNDGTVFFGTKNRDFMAFNGKSGELKWKKTVSRETWLIGNPAYAEKMIFVGSSKDNKLFAIDSETGNIRWAFEANDWVYSSPVYAEGIIFVGSSDKHLYALDSKTGKILWKYQFDSSIYSTPLIENKIVYIGTNDGNIYALK